MQLSSQHLHKIANYQARQRDELSLMQAAVAIILRDTAAGTEFLMMQRAKHENDPWSGQMSFPGGKIEQSDDSPFNAAIRETQEEVGLELKDSDLLGQLDDVYGLKVDNKYSVHVSCYVFKPEKFLEPKGNYEVADLVWLPLAYLADINNAHDYYHPHAKETRMPAVMIDEEKEQILWGLSLRMLSGLYDLLELDLPVLSSFDREHLEQVDKEGLSSNDLAEMRSAHSKLIANQKEKP